MTQSQRQINGGAWTRVRRWAAVWGVLIVLPWRTTEVWAQTTIDECLSKIPTPAWADAASQAFDRAFDSANDGDSFACQGDMRASTVRRAIDQFRAAVLYHDEKALRDVLGFPLRLNRKDPNDSTRVLWVTIKTPSEWWAAQKRYFTARHIAVVSCANLHTVNVVYGRGGYGVMQGYGFIWWQRTSGSPDVKVEVINIDDMTDRNVISACMPPTSVPK